MSIIMINNRDQNLLLEETKLKIDILDYLFVAIFSKENN